jgi:hypothetical protein
VARPESPNAASGPWIRIVPQLDGI